MFVHGAQQGEFVVCCVDLDPPLTVGGEACNRVKGNAVLVADDHQLVDGVVVSVAIGVALEDVGGVAPQDQARFGQGQQPGLYALIQFVDLARPAIDRLIRTGQPCLFQFCGECDTAGQVATHLSWITP
ncbi:hypothetical protein D3C79_859970 [compost metagenome]